MFLLQGVDQVLFWTYGIWLSTARGRQGAGFNVKMLASPNIIAGMCASVLGFSADIVGCIVLYIALPVMTVDPMVSAQNGIEGSYATGLAVMSFFACVITIPLVTFVAL